MNTLVAIRELYTPVQPAVKASVDGVTYCEFLPDTRLQHLIYCYWQLKTTEPLEAPFTYRVVADGCIDIFFELNAPHNNFVMGFCKKFTEFSLDNTFNYVGVRFLPTVFPQLFKISASDVSNRSETLAAVIPATSQFIIDNFTPTQSVSTIKALFDDYFLKLVSKITINNDNRLYGAIESIFRHSGVVNVETDLDTGISPRQLRRLFEFYIGDTAKTFSKVVRFQSILKAKPSLQSLRQNKLFFDAGYYDQAHFIKEFKDFYGVTPGKAFD